MYNKFQSDIKVIIILLAGCCLFHSAFADDVLTPRDVLGIKICGNAQISPDGQWIAYTVSVPRESGDKTGMLFSNPLKRPQTTVQVATCEHPHPGLI